MLLGRIAEVLYDAPFHELLDARIAGPLGLEHWAPIPERALLHSAAVGHVGGSPAAVWNLPASIAPAGALLALSARSLLPATHLFRGGRLIPRSG